MEHQTITLDKLSGEPIQRLEVLSFEPDMYLANVVIADTTYKVYRKQGELLKEFSQLALKKHFKGLAITHTQLIHQSAYDEMIGNPPASNNMLCVDIANPDSDYS